MIVLVVEDDEPIRRVIVAGVPPDFEVRSCATGIEGLRSLTSEHVDILVTDLDVPNVSGEQLVRVARALPWPIGVVVMSGHVDRLEACRGMADSVLAKPFSLSSLRAALRRASDALPRG
jgi:DNA-binding response OmpR family regulator